MNKTVQQKALFEPRKLYNLYEIKETLKRDRRDVFFALKTCHVPYFEYGFKRRYLGQDLNRFIWAL